MKVDRCRSCGAEIIWTIGKSGKRMPLNAKPVPGLFVIDDTGTKVNSRAVGSRIGIPSSCYTSHFATCPDAPKWRST